MGRQQGRKGGGGKGAFRAGKEGKETAGEKRGRDDVWHMDSRDQAQLGNELLDKYYKEQPFSQQDGGKVWEASYYCFKTPLPQATRVNKNHPDRSRIAQLLIDEFAHNGFPLDKDGTESAAFDATAAAVDASAPATASTVLRPLCFIPEGLGMQVPLSRGDIKRGADFKRLKRVLASFNEAGILTRQETVSMVPPLMLDVKPGMRVLDMCAAPGSKTSQLLEALVSGGYRRQHDTEGLDNKKETFSPATKNGGILALDDFNVDNARGVVVANDVNIARIDILTHQTGRSPHCHPNLIITCNDATNYPLIVKPEDKFDRVLCDVMCSGDGTLRKSLDLWSRWNPLQGADLHPSQLRTLLRGMSLVKAGGIVVYSTCSLNPIEDEAVIAEALLQAKGAFELIDPTTVEDIIGESSASETSSSSSPTPSSPHFKTCNRLAKGLHYSPGVNTWKLATKDCSAFFSTFEEAATYRKEVMLDKGFQFRSTMFPPSPTSAEHAEAFKAVAESIGEEPAIGCLHLERSMRILPHLQDTGGFFVAALRCKKDFCAQEQSTTRRFRQQDELRAAHEEVAGREEKQQQLPYVPVADSEIQNIITSTLNICPKTFPFDRLFIRREGFAQVTGKPYYPSSSSTEGGYDSDGKPVTAGRPPRTAKLFLATPEAAQMMRCLPSSVNIKQIGVKAFETYSKYTADKFRIFAESFDTVLPYLIKQQQQEKDEEEKDSNNNANESKRSFLVRVPNAEALEWLMSTQEKSNGRSTLNEFLQRVEVCDVCPSSAQNGEGYSFTTRAVTDAIDFKKSVARKSFAVLCPLFKKERDASSSAADAEDATNEGDNNTLQSSLAALRLPLVVSAELDDALIYVQVKILPHQMALFRLALNGSADDPNAVAAAEAAKKEKTTEAAEAEGDVPANPKSRERDEVADEDDQ